MYNNDIRYISLFAVLLVLLGCKSKALESEEENLGLLIKISERKLSVYRDGEKGETFPIAVGKDTHPTPTGNFEIFQIDWNPDWTPPDSEWTEDAEYTPPGHPENPMGRVRIIYEPPYSIHGTEATESLGKDVSHGSVRMDNEDIMDLARLLMEASGIEKSDEWYEDIKNNEQQMVEIELPETIPLTNQP